MIRGWDVVWAVCLFLVMLDAGWQSWKRDRDRPST